MIKACRGSYTKWHYDVTSQTCKKFSYGGCGGTQNIFDSKDDCEETCGAITELPSDSMVGYPNQNHLNSAPNNYMKNPYPHPPSFPASPSSRYLPQHTSPYLSTHQNYSYRQYSSPSNSMYSNYGPPPVDCEISEWTPWSKCSVSCGRGHKYRTRYIKVPPQNGGAACPHLEHKRKCKGVQCPPNHPFRYQQHQQHQQPHHNQHPHHHQHYATGSYEG